MANGSATFRMRFRALLPSAVRAKVATDDAKRPAGPCYTLQVSQRMVWRPALGWRPVTEYHWRPAVEHDSSRVRNCPAGDLL